MIIKIFRFVLFTWMFLYPVDCSAQLPTINLSFDHYGTSDGLSSNQANCFYRDKEGFLWIGTSRGLNRFDGKHFVVYKHTRDASSLPGNIIQSICEDSKGNIWCATSSGVCYLNKSNGKFKTYRLQADSGDVLKCNNVVEVHCTHKGEIYCCAEYGFYEYNPVKDNFKSYSHKKNDSTSVSANHVFKITEHPFKNGFWLTSFDGFNYFDADKKIFYNRNNNPFKWKVLEPKLIYPACYNKNGTLVFGNNTTFEVQGWDETTNRISTVLPNVANISSGIFFQTIYFDSKNNCWISAWNGQVYFIDGATGKSSQLKNDFHTANNLISNVIVDFYEAEDGSLFFAGNFNLAVYRPYNYNFTILNTAERLKINDGYYHSGYYEDSAGIIWIACDEIGLMKYDPFTDSLKHFTVDKDYTGTNENRKRSAMFSVTEVQGELWCGTRRGIQIFNREKETFRRFNGIPVSEGLDSFSVTWLYQQGDWLWFDSWIKGLFKYNLKTHQYKHYLKNVNDSTAVHHTVIAGYLEDRKHQMWFTDLDGITRYNPITDNFTHFTSNPFDTTKIMGNNTWNMIEDKQGLFWIVGNSVGLAHFNPETGFTSTIKEEDGLPLNSTGNIMLDTLGRVWMASEAGVYFYDQSTNQFTNVNINYGQIINNFSYGCYQLRNGNFLFTNLNCMVELRPQRNISSTKPSKVLISRFAVFDKEIPFTTHQSEIELDYTQNFFSIDYSSFSSSGSGLRYYYMLEKYDNDWRNAGVNQTAAYTDIPGGDYVFKVKAQNEAGIWSDESSFRIKVLPPFYKTNWFKFLVLLCLALIIFFLLKFREKQREKAEAEKSIGYFANSVYGQNSVEEILWDLARNVISRMGFVDCVIYLVDESKNVLVQKAALGAKNSDGFDIANPIEIPFGKGIVGTVATTGKAEIINDTTKDHRYIADDAQRFSEITVPIIYENKVIGVIDSEHPKRNFFTKDHLRILETIASICSTKIIKAQAQQELAAQEKKILAYDKKVAEMHLTALRAQMNPHFIFNALNSIQRYILQNDQDKAEMYLEKFARLIRLILENSRSETVSVKDETELLTLYLEMELLRFANKFDYTIIVANEIDTTETEMPSMIIQPYVENAILHGINYKETKGHIQIEFKIADNYLQCTIEDNGVGRKRAGELKNKLKPGHHSVGLKVTEERLKMISETYGQKATVEIQDVFNEGDTGTRVIIKLPLF